MEKIIQVLVVSKDITTWKSAKHLFSNDKRFQVYPSTEAEFKCLNSMVMCSLNPLIHESITQNSYETLKLILQERISDESLLVIDYTLFNKGIVKIGAMDFLKKYIFNKFQLPITLLVEEHEKVDIGFLKSGDHTTKKEDLNRHLCDLFFSN